MKVAAERGCGRTGSPTAWLVLGRSNGVGKSVGDRREDLAGEREEKE
jgi:hypothetical protein